MSYLTIEVQSSLKWPARKTAVAFWTVLRISVTCPSEPVRVPPPALQPLSFVQAIFICICDETAPHRMFRLYSLCVEDSVEPSSDLITRETAAAFNVPTRKN
jgi:hypothetical protein